MFIHSNSLIWRITKRVGVLLLITTAIICSVYLFTFYHILQNNLNDQQEEMVTLIESNFDSNIGEANIVLDRLFRAINFSYFLDTNNNLSTRDISFFTYNLERALTSNRILYEGKFSNITVYSSNELLHIENRMWSRPLHVLLDDPNFSSVLQSDEFTVIGTANEGNEVTLPIFRKIYTHNPRRLVGVVEIKVPIRILLDYDAVTTSSEFDVVVLCDQTGDFIYGSSEFSYESRILLRDRIQERILSGLIQLDGVSYIQSLRNHPTVGIYFGILTPRSSIYWNLMTQVVVIILISLILYVTLLVVIFTLLKNDLKRILLLDSKMQQVGEGNFEVVIQEDQVQDEISRITRTFNEMASRLTQVIKEKLQQEQVLQEAELKSLHAQINPHFLYNTLETMRMQCEIDEYYTHGNNLKLLSDLFRYSIRWGNKEAPFIMEWDNLVNYLKIMQLRFGEDISYDLQYEYDMDDVLVPKMLLQPLVENSFGHGFKEMLPPWRLSVHVTKEEENMSIVICDNGTGIEKERLIELQGYLSQETTDSEYRSNQESIGLMNTKQRLRMICGDQSNIEIDSEYGEGTTIVITIPL